MRLLLKLFIIIFVSVFVAVSSYAVYTSTRYEFTIGEVIRDLPRDLAWGIIGIIVSIQDLFEKEVDVYLGINTPNNYKYEEASFIIPGRRHFYLERIGKEAGTDLPIYLVEGANFDLLFVNVGDYGRAYSRVGYEVSDPRTITAVFSKHSSLTQHQGDIDKFLRIVNDDGRKYNISIEKWWEHSAPFYFEYIRCPVVKQSPGYIAYADDKWLFVTDRAYRNYSKAVEKNMDYLKSIGKYNSATQSEAYGKYKGIGTIITDTEIIEMLKSERMRQICHESAQQMMNNE